MQKITSFLWRWGPALLMMSVIFGFSSIPSAEMPSFGLLDFVVKKGGHALGYGLLALAFLRGLKGESNAVFSCQLLVAWILATLYSATDEYHQSFVPGRHPAYTDVMIDAFGAGMALLLIYRFRKKETSQKLVAEN
jgi:VanZ family protein